MVFADIYSFPLVIYDYYTTHMKTISHISRLHMFYKINLPSYSSSTDTVILYQNLTINLSVPPSLLIIIPITNFTTTEVYSFFPRTIRDWNDLPNDVIESNTLPLFISSLLTINPKTQILIDKFYSK